jgi:stage II sporulation protein D
MSLKFLGVFMKRTVFLKLFSVLLIVLVQHEIHPFDVKVLLKKINFDSSTLSEIELHSKHGFVFSHHKNLSCGASLPCSKITIQTGHATIRLNGKKVDEKILYVYPALPKTHKEALTNYVRTWFEQNMQGLDLSDLQAAHALFDRMVGKNAEQVHDSTALLACIQEIIQIFLQEFIDTIQEPPAVTAQVLESYVNELFLSRFKPLFLDLVSVETMSKQERKNIEKNVQARYEFFDSKMYGVAQRFMQEFVLILPSKLQQQFLHDGVNAIEFEHNQYLGAFVLFQEKNQLLVINNLDIDDYLISVIKHEGWPGWPLEMNKVLAIACRTYLIWQILQAQKIDRPYHIENGIKHQTYKGHHINTKLKQAIVQTRDMFVSFDEKPALTMYDACCGGIIPANIDDPSHKKISYLARSYPCTFCKNFKIFHWQAHFNEAELLKRLEKDFPKVTKIISMSVAKRDRAGLVKKVLINFGSKKVTITEKKLKSLFPEIKSFCFDIDVHSNRRFEISGRGYGHHKGLCQWGAYKLTRDDGWNFEQVLQFYYPGTKLMKLTYQR